MLSVSGEKIDENVSNVDYSSEASKLVSEAYYNDTANGKVEATSITNKIFTGLFKILGFDSEKIGAIAVNGLIFLAQLLGTSLLSNTSRAYEVKEIKNLNLETLIPIELGKITNQSLTEYVMEYVKERLDDDKNGCVQLLICKIAPFVWKMQNYFFNNDTNSENENIIFSFLPSRAELLEQSQACGNKYICSL
ncbi:unnamed protein product [Ceutorhynchus assimilis]|uniref:Uncharacterized protein n=1 Tax=Ceutorhynchus assimilis TaxID=467358 RepID=A0A9N9MKF9_9CUCU|nr:unnamed protein product [Ceutorhynchus assimilis]